MYQLPDDIQNICSMTTLYQCVFTPYVLDYQKQFKKMISTLQFKIIESNNPDLVDSMLEMIQY